eukprot:CAMPEP_0173075970 /NCGR_PEP_ID=MMETSP1102-20130122/12046_1 /TAXON_ID=49646 /ORGANISM="Geminigera sp., Strain Caron Lab Isolate" /LENGTH=35 /DNA_ID= /DNA_START= /DNA_END= /DNA_ORIENTATION=
MGEALRLALFKALALGRLLSAASSITPVLMLSKRI